MSEVLKSYCSSVPTTIEGFRNRPCSLDIDNPDFVQPTAAEVRALRGVLGLSQASLAKFVGVAWNRKGSNTVRKWESDESSAEHRSIPLSAWKLMLIKAGLVDVEVFFN